MTISQNMKKKFLDKLRTALKECLEIVDLEHDKLLSKDPDGFYIPRLDNYPVVHFYKDNPFPYIQLYPRIIGKKTDYLEILNRYLSTEKIPSLDALERLCYSDSYLSHFYSTPLGGSTTENAKKYASKKFIIEFKNLVNHIASIKNRSPKKIEEKLKLWLNSIFGKTISFDIVIPLLNLNTECKSFSLSNKVRIQKMTIQDHLDRNIRTGGSISVKEEIVFKASHALIFERFLTINNIKRSKNIYNALELYENKKAEINRTIQIMNLISDSKIGYCQLLFRQGDHECKWFGETAYSEIFGERKYPGTYDSTSYFSEGKLHRSELFEIRKFSKINLQDKRLSLAINKLNSSKLRSSSNDSIIDIATALESLLSDKSDVLKFKLALRGSIIASIFKFSDFAAVEVKQGIKQFYDLRSSIVHGNHKNFTRLSKLKIGRDQITLHQFGQDLLRHILIFLVKKPSFIEVSRIDNYYIRNK